MFDWLNYDLFTVTGLDLILRIALLALVVILLIRSVLLIRQYYRKQNARIRANLERETAFSTLGRQLSSATTPSEAARVIAETAQHLLGWDAFSLRMLHETADRVETVLDVDTVDGKRVETPAMNPQPSPMMKKVLAEGPQLILREDPRQADDGAAPFGNVGRRSASLMFVPVREQGRNIGVLSIQSYTRQAYDRAALEVLQRLGEHCGGALERITAQQLLREAHDELERRVADRTEELQKANALLLAEVEKHRQTEAALAYEQHLLKSLMDNVPDYIYFKDLQGRFTRVNTAFANQYFNVEPAQMIGKTDFDFLSHQAAQESFDDEQRIIATGKPILAKEEHEFWLDGREWWCLTSKMPFRDQTGKIVGTFGITRDITQRKQAEEALQQAQVDLEKRVRERTAELSCANERLLAEVGERKQAEARSAAFSALGRRLSEVRSPEDAARVILEAADEMLGWDAAYLQLYTPDYQRVLPVLCADIIDGQRVMTRDYLKNDSLTARDRRLISEGAELLLRAAPEASPEFSSFGDRSRRSLSLMFVPIRNGQKVIGALSIQSYQPDAYSQEDLRLLQALADFCYGVMDRLQAEERSRQSERRFSVAFLSSPVPMTLSTLQDGRYLDVNDSVLKLLGYRREEMVGRTSVELRIWPSAEERQKMVEAVARHGSVRDLECEFRTKAGRIRKVLLSVQPMDFAGEATILATLHDITDRLLLEEQLRQSQKMEAVGQLAAGVAHDFNNILTIIQGHISLVQSVPGLDQDMAGSLNQMAMATDRAANLTRQLLTFSRKQVIQPTVLDLNDVIGTASNMLQRLVGENISLHFNYSPQLPAIHADSGMIEQILMNLAVNARDAMPRGGRLIVSTSSVYIDAARTARNPEARPGQFVCLSIEDTGCGMDPATLERIFEPFFTTKEVGKGTGLGLATVYGIVKQHHGWIEVESTLGRGTTFRILLPTSARQAQAPQAAPAARVNGGDETILVVEDEPSLRQLVRGILEIYGYRVLEACHGKDALGVWREHRDEIDLLLTDIVMPEGLSGLELAELLREEEPSLKVIYTSGYSVDLFNQKIPLTEGVDFIPKPYKPPVLAKAIRACLDS